MKKIFTLALLTVALQHANAQVCIENSNSITFDGFSNYASPGLQSNLNITDSITIEAWINSNAWAFNSANNTIVCKHGWSNSEGGFVLRCGGTGELSFNIAGLDVNQNPTSWKEAVSPASTLTLGTWTHVAGSYDGQNLKVFINGVEQNSVAFQGSIVTSPNYPLTIGKLSDPVQAASRFFNGKIDEVRIWHRALTAAQLMANMNKHIDPAAAVGLVSYWRFNEGTGANSADLQSSNNATLNGNTWDVSVPFNNVPPVPTITFNGLVLTASTSGQWFFNGNPIAGATNIDYTPLVAGDYTFTTDPNLDGCTSTSVVYAVTSVGIKNTNNKLNVTVYPNPMMDEAVLSINANQDYNNTIFLISDITGRQVYAQPTPIKSGLNQININKNTLTSGVYFYEFVSNTLSISNGKILVK